MSPLAPHRNEGFEVAKTRLDLVALLCAVGLAFGLRLTALADASMWWDEAWSAWLARQGVQDIARITAADVHPPLYYWLLHLWRVFAGESEFAARFLSVAAGTLTVVALWCLARWLMPERRWVAVMAALLLAASRFAVWWSQETRMYVLGGLLATLSLAATVRLRRQASARLVLGYVLVTLAALWTLYLLAFLLAIEGLYWLWTLRSETSAARLRRLGQWVGLQLAVLLGWAPWLYYALPRLRSGSVQTAFSPAVYLQLYATLLSVGSSVYVERYLWPTLAVACLLVLGLAALLVRRRAASPGQGESLLLLGLTLAVPPAAVWLATMLPRSFGYVPKPEARYLLPYAPAFYLLLAWAVAGLADGIGRVRHYVAIGLCLVPVVLNLWSLRGYYADRVWSDDYRSLSLTLRAYCQPDDQVVLQNDEGWPVFAYHWAGAYAGVPNRWEIDAPTAERFLAPLWQEHAAVWLVVDENALQRDPLRLLEGWLGERAAARKEWRYGLKRLLLFARTPERADRLLQLAPGLAPAPPRTQVSDDGLSLVGWEQPVRNAQVGDVVHVAAYVARRDSGGEIRLSLGQQQVARTEIPSGQGLLRLEWSMQILPEAVGAAVPWRVQLGSAQAIESWMRVRGLPAVTQPPAAPQHAVAFTLGEPPAVRLVGYDLARTEGNLRVTLYWRAVERLPLSLKVFVHLEDDQGHVVAQRDDYPVQGARPTTSWQPGEVIVDAYDIALTSATPAGSFALSVGLYDLVTGQRLGPVFDQAGQVQPNAQAVLGRVQIP